MADRVIIVVPARDEAATLPAVLSGLVEVVDRCAGFAETRILLVDDGSRDNTPSIATAFGCEIIRHGKNLGYGAALRSGFAHARQERYDYAVTIDADGQHRPHDVTSFLMRRKRGTIVSGSRYLPQSLRTSVPPAPLVNGLFTALVNLAFSLDITDVGCGLKSMDVRLLDQMRLDDSGYFFPLEFWRECRSVSAEVDELPIPMIYCDAGRNLRSKFGSIEEALDRAIHFLVTLLLRGSGPYSPAWADAYLGVPRSDSESLLMRDVGRELFSPRWHALPLRRARANFLRVMRSERCRTGSEESKEGERIRVSC